MTAQDLELRLRRIEGLLETVLSELSDRTDRYEREQEAAYRRGYNAGRSAQKRGVAKARGPYKSRHLEAVS
jgi:hypothetical protein